MNGWENFKKEMLISKFKNELEKQLVAKCGYHKYKAQRHFKNYVNLLLPMLEDRLKKS